MGKAKAWMVVVVLVLAAAAAGLFLAGRMGGQDEVVVLCGGSMRAALEEVIQRYGGSSKDKVVATYGGSGELCAQIQEAKRCDVFICHDPFMPWAAGKGLIDAWATVGYLDVVLITGKGNPKGITKLEDLGRPGLRIGIGHRKLSTSGQIVKHLLSKLPEHEKAILANVRLETKGHQQRCFDVSEGTLDAALVWQAVAHQFREKLDIIPLREKYGHLIDTITTPTYKESDLRNTQVTVGLTAAAKDKPEARRFYEFVVSQGPAVFKEKGFRMPAE